MDYHLKFKTSNIKDMSDLKFYMKRIVEFAYLKQYYMKKALSGKGINFKLILNEMRDLKRNLPTMIKKTQLLQKTYMKLKRKR